MLLHRQRNDKKYKHKSTRDKTNEKNTLILEKRNSIRMKTIETETRKKEKTTF